MLNEAYASLDALDAAEKTDAEQNANAAHDSLTTNRTWSIAVLVIGLSLALGLGLWVARRIVVSLTKVTGCATGWPTATSPAAPA